MKVLIIEDERHNAARLQRILNEIAPESMVLDVLESVRDSVNWFSTGSVPDVVLMDIRLADGSGFDIFSKVHVPCPVIFTTAYDEYAVKAFKVNSIDYLLKPIEKEELQQALGRVKSRDTPSEEQVRLIELLEVFRERTAVYRKRFLLPSHDGFKTVSVEDIDYFYSEFKVTHLVTYAGVKEPLPLTMEDLEEELDPAAFFRANRQLILGVQSIHSIRHDFNGKLKVFLKRNPGLEIVVSREKAPLFKAWLDR